MRALIQRVSEGSVTVDHEITGRIDQGIVALVGVTHSDQEPQAVKLAKKIWELRVFEDVDGKMNRSASDGGLPILVISQFTLYGNAEKGRRPSFVDAARPEVAEPLIEVLISELRMLGAHVETGRFRTDMKVSLVNDGPVTLMLEV